MKIDVTYEKADILRLVKEDLERRQIRLKAGSSPEYKGALLVKLSIEADDEGDVPPQKAQPGGDSLVKPPLPESEEDDAPLDMSAVLQQSNKIAATTSPKFKLADDETKLQRRLGNNESLEFPREE